MKCPNCEGVLPGSAIACKACGHRLTQNSVDKWRSENKNSEASSSAVAESPIAAKLRERFAAKTPTKSESNLIQFPVPANVSVPESVAISSKGIGEPAWRDRVKARVQDHRQRQRSDDLMMSNETNVTTELGEKTGTADQLLLVESALKRIRRTPAPPPATAAFRARQTPLHYPAAQTHALALMPEAERYAEEQRESEPTEITGEVPAFEIEPASKPLPSPTTTARALKSLRSTHKLTGIHFTLPPEESSTATDNAVPHSLDTLSLAADVAETIETVSHELVEAKPVERLRAKATHFAKTQAAHPTATEGEINPWHTDAEVEAAAVESDGQVWFGKPAPIWLRTMAGICDFEAAAFLYLPFFSAYWTLKETFDTNDYYLMILMAVVVMFLYQLVTFTLNGRTMGMALCGLRNFDVERVNSNISFTRRLQQAFGGTVGLFCPPFNFIVTRVTGFQRGFGDALAKTVTLRRAQE